MYVVAKQLLLRQVTEMLRHKQISSINPILNGPFYTTQLWSLLLSFKAMFWEQSLRRILRSGERAIRALWCWWFYWALALRNSFQWQLCLAIKPQICFIRVESTHLERTLTCSATFATPRKALDPKRTISTSDIVSPHVTAVTAYVYTRLRSTVFKRTWLQR